MVYQFNVNIHRRVSGFAESAARGHPLEHALQVIREFGDRIVTVREEVGRLLGQQSKGPPTPLTVVYFPKQRKNNLFNSTDRSNLQDNYILTSDFGGPKKTRYPRYDIS